MDGPAVFNLADLFEAVADHRGDDLAVVSSTARASYRQLDRLASCWATALAAAGVDTGDRVALMLRNHLDHVAALLGSFKLRAVPLNVNLHYTAEELRHLLADADPAVVVCEDELEPTVRSAVEQAAWGPHRPAAVRALGAFAAEAAAVAPAERRHDRDGGDGYLLYTGGTTGLPKGVEWRQEDLFFAALGGDSRVDGALGRPADALAALRHAPTRVLVACPLMHGTAQWVTLGALLSGGTVVLFTEDAFDADALLELAERERVAQLVVVGDAFAVPLADALDARPDHWSLDELVVVASGGASLATETARRLLHHLPGAVVVDGYGTSETGGHARHIHVPGASGADRTFRPDPDTGLIGFDGVVLGRDSDELGRIGRCGHIPLGYRNDPTRTAVTFPVIAGRRWALTGDLGRWRPDGSIELVGRGERTVNSGGEKVDALEVESVVRTHPAVADAMVVGVPDARFGEVVGVLVKLAPGASLSVEQLARYCRSSLARFKLPRHVAVVEHLPRTPTGKPDYRAAVSRLRKHR
ncbi:MAG: AMP-binding protein [Acidimicrobiia bacterium]